MKLLIGAAIAALVATPTSAFSAGLPRFAAASAVKAATYLVGADVESINPTAAMISSTTFYLGGYGLSSGNIGNNLIPLPATLPGVTPRAAIGSLGSSDTDGTASTREPSQSATARTSSS